MPTLQDEGRRRERAGDHDQAALLFQIHLRTNPADLEARKRLRASVRRHGDRPPGPVRRMVARAARKLTIDAVHPLDDLPRCEQLLERDPYSVPALVRLGQAAMRGGLREVGLWAFKDALTLSPKDPEILIALIPFCTAPRDCFVLGRALYTQDLIAHAVGPLRRAAAAIPFAAKAGFLLGQCLLKLGKHDEAVEALRRARRDEPHGSMLWNDITYLLARIPDRAGCAEQATQHYRELAKCGSERSLFALAERTGSLHVVTDLRPETCDRAAVDALPKTFAETYRVCPVEFTDGALVVALADPVGGGAALDDLRFMLNQDVVGAVADPEQVDATIAALYGVEEDEPWPWVQDETPLVPCGLTFEPTLPPEPPPLPVPRRDPDPAQVQTFPKIEVDLDSIPILRTWADVSVEALPVPVEPPRVHLPVPVHPTLPRPPARARFTREGAAAAVSAVLTWTVAWFAIFQLGLLP